MLFHFSESNDDSKIICLQTLSIMCLENLNVSQPYHY